MTALNKERERRYAQLEAGAGAEPEPGQHKNGDPAVRYPPRGGGGRVAIECCGGAEGHRAVHFSILPAVEWTWPCVFDPDRFRARAWHPHWEISSKVFVATSPAWSWALHTTSHALVDDGPCPGAAGCSRPAVELVPVKKHEPEDDERMMVLCATAQQDADTKLRVRELHTLAKAYREVVEAEDQLYALVKDWHPDTCHPSILQFRELHRQMLEEPASICGCGLKARDREVNDYAPKNPGRRYLTCRAEKGARGCGLFVFLAS